jgi:SAM-dependent methyltransferase
MIRSIRNWLLEPSVKVHDVESLACSLAHRQALQYKALLRQLFEGFYHECRLMDLRYFSVTPGLRLEIGSGSSRIKDVYPDVITSDVKHLPFLDIVLRGEEMPFPANSLRAIYAINVFHHFPQPRLFFRELSRVLHPGGGIIFIEPFHSPFARWLFKNLHSSEGFDPNAPAWEATAPTGPLSNANQALSYIVFHRDRKQFEQEFPDFAISLDRPHTHLQYLASGGVNFRQLVPDYCARLVQRAEQMLSPLNSWLALQHTIVLQKRPVGDSAHHNG